MSLRPLLASVLNEPYYWSPSRYVDDFAENAVDYNELMRLQNLLSAVNNAALLSRAMQAGRPAGRGGSEVKETSANDSDFKVNLDIRQFRPEEVSVKLVDNRVVIHAKHEEREDQHGFIKREFTRSYLLPNDVDKSKLEAKVGHDGTLRIIAPRQGVEKPKETVIPIQHELSNPASLSNANATASTSGNPTTSQN